jgi:hypothetical protein
VARYGLERAMDDLGAIGGSLRAFALGLARRHQP